MKNINNFFKEIKRLHGCNATGMKSGVELGEWGGGWMK